jgi:hypothetical protein
MIISLSWRYYLEVDLNLGLHPPLVLLIRLNSHINPNFVACEGIFLFRQTSYLWVAVFLHVNHLPT